MTQVLNIKSGFAILDVKAGRAKLHKIVGSSSDAKGVRVPVVIKGFITSAWGNDDGISREFEVEVAGVELGEPEASK